MRRMLDESVQRTRYRFTVAPSYSGMPEPQATFSIR
jgi:hypothetical protein